MALVTTAKEEEDQVIAELAMALSIERQMSDELVTLLNDIYKEFQATYVALGEIFNIKKAYKDDMVALLRKYYRRTQKKFLGQLTDSVNVKYMKDLELKQGEEKDKAEFDEDNVLAGMAIFTLGHSQKQADFILETTTKQIDDTIDKVIINGARDGKALSPLEVARQTASDLQDKSRGRADTIATLEVGTIIEDTKQREAEAVVSSTVDSRVATGVVVSKLKKKWVALLDQKTRLAHAQADGQVRELYDFFLVGGELLKYPRDTVNGSIGNTINCRCGTVHTF